MHLICRFSSFLIRWESHVQNDFRCIQSNRSCTGDQWFRGLMLLSSPRDDLPRYSSGQIRRDLANETRITVHVRCNRIYRCRWTGQPRPGGLHPMDARWLSIDVSMFQLWLHKNQSLVLSDDRHDRSSRHRTVSRTCRHDQWRSCSCQAWHLPWLCRIETTGRVA